MTLALLSIAQHVPDVNTFLQKHTHSEPHTTHNIGVALTTR